MVGKSRAMIYSQIKSKRRGKKWEQKLNMETEK